MSLSGHRWVSGYESSMAGVSSDVSRTREGFGDEGHGSGAKVMQCVTVVHVGSIKDAAKKAVHKIGGRYGHHAPLQRRQHD